MGQRNFKKIKYSTKNFTSFTGVEISISAVLGDHCFEKGSIKSTMALVHLLL